MSKKKITIILIIILIIDFAGLFIIFLYLDKKQTAILTEQTQNLEIIDSLQTFSLSAGIKTDSSVLGKVAAFYGNLANGIKNNKSTAIARIDSVNTKVESEKVLNAIFQNAHEAQSEYYQNLNLQTEKQWDEFHQITNENAPQGDYILDPDITVFGWHPYWMGSSYRSYNYSLLTEISYFSYELDPATGNYFSIHDWYSTPLIDSAHNNGCRVSLTVTNFEEDNNSIFLNDTAAQVTLISNLCTLLNARSADGVTIDFEGISAIDQQAFTGFITKLHQQFTLCNPSLYIAVVLPPVDYRNAFNLAALDSMVERFIITGYNYNGETSVLSGPSAPLHSSNKLGIFSLDNTILAYMQQVHPKKLIVALPYFGIESLVYKHAIPSPVAQINPAVLYRTLKKEIPSLAPVLIDSLSETAIREVYQQENGYFKQTWFDNSYTLNRKYQWIINNQLGGIGIWALGYDNGNSDLWEVIQQKFAGVIRRDSTQSIIYKIKHPKITQASSYSAIDLLRGNAMFLKKDIRLSVLVLLGSFMIILLLHIVSDITPWKDQFIKRIVIYSAISVLILVSILFAIINWGSPSGIYSLFFCGLMAGYICFLFSKKFTLKVAEKVP